LRIRIEFNAVLRISAFFLIAGPDPVLDDDKKIEENLKLNFFLSKTAMHLYPGLHKGRPSYSRSLQPLKENIQQYTKHEISQLFTFFCGSFLPLPDPRIQQLK
jgi:hypothetical protein